MQINRVTLQYKVIRNTVYIRILNCYYIFYIKIIYDAIICKIYVDSIKVI